MADEAVITTLLGNQGDPVEYTVADGTAIPKGSLMKISGDKTMVIATAAGLFCGILANEKKADNGTTKKAVITHCIAEMTCGAGETAVLGGTVMVGAAANEIDVAVGDTVNDSAKVIGISLETIGNNGTGAILVNAMKRL